MIPWYPSGNENGLARTVDKIDDQSTEVKPVPIWAGPPIGEIRVDEERNGPDFQRAS